MEKKYSEKLNYSINRRLSEENICIYKKTDCKVNFLLNEQEQLTFIFWLEQKNFLKKERIF